MCLTAAVRAAKKPQTLMVSEMTGDEEEHYGIKFCEHFPWGGGQGVCMELVLVNISYLFLVSNGLGTGENN